MAYEKAPAHYLAHNRFLLVSSFEFVIHLTACQGGLKTLHLFTDPPLGKFGLSLLVSTDPKRK